MKVIRPVILALVIGAIIWTMCNYSYGGTDNSGQELLDAMILVNEHDGLSDWGLEQMESLLDDAGYN